MTSNLQVLALSDEQQRLAALNTGRSYIMRAPAGSGKTSVLTQRFLALLATVDEPEQVVAITFTRPATAEMRARVVEALHAAANGKSADGPNEEMTLELARRALARSNERGWKLLEQSQRLRIETIDAVALSVARRMPLLSRLDPGGQPVDEAQEFYLAAANATLLKLSALGDQKAGDSERKLAIALGDLLRQRDNNVTDCCKLIAEMLMVRDQWRRHFQLDKPLTNEDRSRMEQAIANAKVRAMRRVGDLLRKLDEGVQIDLVRLARHAALHSETGNTLELHDLQELPLGELDDELEMLGLFELLLTQGGAWRKKFDRGNGFPQTDPQAKSAMLALVNSLRENETLREALCEVPKLPPTRYSDEEWSLIQSTLLVLRHAVAELKLIFARSGTIDFAEATICALAALEEDTASGEREPSDLALALGARIQHLLVDEFQDTSFSQNELLSLLTAGWEEGDGRTLFLVGDPMQSIYLFRQAEVRLFAAALKKERLGGVPLGLPLELKSNFRSLPELVRSNNDLFQHVFAGGDIAHSASAPVTKRNAAVGEKRSAPAIWRAVRKEGRHPTRDEKRQEAAYIVETVREIQAADKNASTAILVRTRKNADAVVEALKRANIPFSAEKMEALSERQEVLDAVALTRAILHPADRLAWLSVLRAPWCGLTITDLERLAGTPLVRRGQLAPCIAELMDTQLGALSADGQARARRVHAALASARKELHSASAATVVERAWDELGGPECVGEHESANVEAYFAMLDQLERAGQPVTGELIKVTLERLFAQPDPAAGESVHLMTIHGAKGLEFDFVIVPQMQYDKSGKDDHNLLELMEQAGGGDEAELIVSAIHNSSESAGALRSFVRREKRKREADELKRLLYVAATRARKQVVFTATLERDELGGWKRPSERSMLGLAWDAIAEQVEEVGAEERAGLAIAAAGDDWGEEQRGYAKLVRVPAGWAPPERERRRSRSNPIADGPIEEQAALSRGLSGSVMRRQVGTVLHAMLERIATSGKLGNAKQYHATVKLMVRASGMPPRDCDAAVAQVMRQLETALSSPNGRWVMTTHAEAQTELAVSVAENGELRNMRPDRIFAAGAEPLSTGNSHIWIVDYKTAEHGEAGGEEFYAMQREIYAPIVARYAEAYRNLTGDARPVCCALYFPAADRLERLS